MKKIRFGIIGCGLMGKEFASAAARWCHFTEAIARPEIVGVCDFSDAAMDWFSDNFDSVVFRTKDYKELLKREDIDAIYCALPHNLHGQVYSDIINAGKHLLGEKPFGIDQAANAQIMEAIKNHPEVVVRCASEFPYYPACQQLIKWIKEGKFGQIIEVRTGFFHSSDMDLSKPMHEIVLMNYGGTCLHKEYLQKAHELCKAYDTPIMVDEIQSGIWYEELFLFRKYELEPDFVIIGKGFSGGEYPASKIITTAQMDTLNQFGALVTNGQEELASLSYLICSLCRKMGRLLKKMKRNSSTVLPQWLKSM